ncbi:MAG: hypothetical protein U5K72_03270 [Balneolaceae bacterium]|nr:hypothetical protein [Balneolaceae bacterium]
MSILENGVAHHNSRLNSIEKILADRLEGSEIEGIELSEIGDIFVIKPDFARRSFDIIENHLNSIMKDYEKKYT